MLALVSPLSERNRVAAFAPCFESFLTVPQLITGQPTIVIPTDDKCDPDLNAFAACLKEHHKQIGAIIINSPNNPSGRVYSRTIIESLANILKEYPEIGVISDEVYRTITFDEHNPHISLASYLPNQTLVVSGTSKECAGTGIRVGYVAGPQHIIEGIAKLSGHATSSVNLPAQKGYAKFLRSDIHLTDRNAIRDILKKKRDVLIKQFQTVEGLQECEYEIPLGTFYFFPSMKKFIGRKTPEGKVLENDEQLAFYLINENVVTIPGLFYLKEGYLRMAYGRLGEEEIIKGAVALGEALKKLQ